MRNTLILPVALLAWCAAGCQPILNPFEDTLADRPRPVSASVEGARAATPVPTEQLVRYEEPIEMQVVDGSVLHGPLFFEDPYHDAYRPELDDGNFAWTGTDYWHMVYWRGRFLVNLVMAPVTAFATPPWIVMESDGIPSREVLWDTFDARKHDPTPADKEAAAGPRMVGVDAGAMEQPAEPDEPDMSGDGDESS